VALCILEIRKAWKKEGFNDENAEQDNKNERSCYLEVSRQNWTLK
jgi:hypothetical protein